MPRFHVTRRSFALFATAALATQLGAVAQATEAWPSKPIRIIVPNPPAGPSDSAIRPLAAAVQKVLGQPVIVENKAGANGNIGAAEVARAPADGYTWFWAMDPVLTVNKHIYKNIGYSSDAIVVLNAAAYTHTSVALMDAIKGAELPVIELHISNVHAREAFRHHSYIAPVAKAVICGLGVQGYSIAIDAVAQVLLGQTA